MERTPSIAELALLVLLVALVAIIVMGFRMIWLVVKSDLAGSTADEELHFPSATNDWSGSAGLPAPEPLKNTSAALPRLEPGTT